jgi:hypothetical protein
MAPAAMHGLVIDAKQVYLNDHHDAEMFALKPARVLPFVACIINGKLMAMRQ